MKTLGNYYHDFPKLAKQTGYFFHLYRGKVNWNELEELNLDDITENRNFELLEQNLLNVINCNLEKEYDLKILDKNFVKLFKLAQLGVDYLSFCELYLDKCVILLQEKLISFQEKCEFLKQENEKKNEELRRRKKKTSNSNYQCEKCEKFFISEFYLKGHDKRRHSNPTTPNISSRINSVKRQENDQMEKSTTVLTNFEKKYDSEIYDIEGTKKLECENFIKIKNLEKNLEELEDRLKKAESNSSKMNQNSIHSFPYSQLFGMAYSQIPPNPTSCFSHTEICCSKKNQDSNMSDNFSNFFKPDYSSALKPSTVNTVISKTSQTPFTASDSECDIIEGHKSEKERVTYLKDKDFQIPELEVKNDNCGKKFSAEVENDNCDKKFSAKLHTNFKSVEINKELESPISKPKTLSIQAWNDETKICKKFDKAFTSNDSQGSDKEQNKESMQYFNQEDMKIHKNFIQENSGKKSSFQRIKKKTEEKSSDRQSLFRNFKKSLNCLSTNVFSIDSNFNVDENGTKDLKSIAKNKMNYQLKKLGVDPEWNGIPTKTMIRSLQSLQQQQKIFAKRNSNYPTVRHNLEKWIFKKLTEKHENVEGKSELNECRETFNHNSDNLQPSKKNVTSVQKTMYDSISESESESSIEDRNINEKCSPSWGRINKNAEKSNAFEISSEKSPKKTHPEPHSYFKEIEMSSDSSEY